MNIFDKLKKGLEKTTSLISSKIAEITGKEHISEEELRKLEELLLLADVGPELSSTIIQKIKEKTKKEGDLKKILKETIVEFLPPVTISETFPTKPWIIMVVGINGTGKTTTCAKLAYRYKNAGYRVLLGAADTFRAAGQTQLEYLAEKAGIDIVLDLKVKDPGAIAYKTVERTLKENYDIAIIDTAGRLHTKTPLMQELARVKRIISKLMEGAPHEVMLTIDAITGTNALRQAQEFVAFTGVTSIIITKMDGTAKGGCVIPVSYFLKLPVKYAGVGEGLDDLIPFNPIDFADAFLNGRKENSSTTMPLSDR